LAEHDGPIEHIVKDPTGGLNIHIKGTVHFAPHGRELTVKKGDVVKKGDALTEGPKNPREMLKLTGINSVQSYLVNEIQKHYKNSAPLSRRNTETFVRAMTNLSEVTDPGDHPDFLRGDYVLVAFNKKLSSGKRIIKHEPILDGVDILPLDMQEDWIARLQSRNLRDTVVNAAAEGWRSMLHSTHPIPGMAYGKEFGKGTEKEPWLY
jgi:DNA-directed RNA polymerase subunit beta'